MSTIPSDVTTYIQNRQEGSSEDRPEERWRCSISTSEGIEYNGVGETEAEAIHNASIAYFRRTCKAEQLLPVDRAATYRGN